MPEARPTLYLVDAMSNIHRAYHAIQRLSTSAGRPTNAIYGFVTMLRKMLRERSPDYLAVAWDGPQRTARHEAYADYKANRPAMADDLAGQLPEIRRVLEAYRIPVLELPGYEADDVIGTLASEGLGGRFRRRHRHGRQGHAAAGRAGGARLPHRAARSSSTKPACASSSASSRARSPTSSP